MKIKINLPQHLVLFLTAKYGTTFKATRHSILGEFAIDLLSKNYVRDKKIDSKNHFVFTISKSIERDFGSYVLPERYKDFERKINMLFNEALYAHVIVSVNSDVYIQAKKSTVKQTAMNAIQGFLNYYGITEDHLKLETTYRQYLRINERMNAIQNGTYAKKPKKAVSKTISKPVKPTVERQKPNTLKLDTAQTLLLFDM